MEDSNAKGLANHNGSESCGDARESSSEALTGECVGWVLSHEIKLDWDADPVGERGRREPTCRIDEAWRYPARSEAPGMHGNNLRENWEIVRPSKPARLGCIEKSKDVRR